MGLTWYDSGRIIGAPFRIRGLPTLKLFQPLLWSLMGAGVAGAVFFVLNQPAGTVVSISVSSPTPTIAVQPSAMPKTQLVNINLAPAWLLAALPGIGETRAQAIVDYREAEGPFQRIDQLMQVPGIGSAIYQGLRGMVTVGELP